jgi:hypothetical protein
MCMLSICLFTFNERTFIKFFLIHFQTQLVYMRNTLATWCQCYKTLFFFDSNTTAK